MKPHIIIKLREHVASPELPHWTEILSSKASVRETFIPEVDRALRDHHVEVWPTREYQPRTGSWSPEEVASGLNRFYRLVLQRNRDVPPDLVREIQLLPGVEEAHAGRVGEVELTPPRAQAMGRRAGEETRDAIGLPEAHRFTAGEPTVTVAVLDTGIAYDHPELAASLEPGRDFVNIIDGAGEFLGDFLDADEDPDDEVGHGTHVAGIIAGRGSAMPPGVTPRCRVMGVRVLAAMLQGDRRVGAGLVENINAGTKWAVDQGVDVVNMSLGVRHTGGGLPHRAVVDYAAKMGVTIVAASGNDGTDELYYPGAFESVITVGAADADGRVAPFSTFGPQVTLIAPGVDVYSSYLNRDYAFSTGTSHAAPFVAGAVALLKSYAISQGRRLGDRHVKHILKHTSDKVGVRFKDRKAGFGMLNLVDALRLLEARLN